MARENSDVSPEDSEFEDDLAGTLKVDEEGGTVFKVERFSSDLNFLKRPIDGRH